MRLENPRWNVIDPVLGPAPQILERGSSVTNNSLAANQRPNISLIDRRLSVARRVPYRVRLDSNKTCLARKQGAASPLDTGKPYQRFGLRRAAADFNRGAMLPARPQHLKLDETFTCQHRSVTTPRGTLRSHTREVAT